MSLEFIDLTNPNKNFKLTNDTSELIISPPTTAANVNGIIYCDRTPFSTTTVGWPEEGKTKCEHT